MDKRYVWHSMTVPFLVNQPIFLWSEKLKKYGLGMMDGPSVLVFENGNHLQYPILHRLTFNDYTHWAYCDQKLEKSLLTIK